MALVNFYPSLSNFLNEAGWENSTINFLAGDASLRKYYRVTKNDKTCILMDAPFPENPSQFIKIDHLLAQNDIRVPKIYNYDLEQGLVLLEDLGDTTLKGLIAKGEDPAPYYRKSIDILKKIYLKFKNQGCPQFVPQCPEDIVIKQCDTFLDWYWPSVIRCKPTFSQRSNFYTLWETAAKQITTIPFTLLLKDYHVENLMILDNQELAVIDFQDAIWGPCLYDVMSIIEDARIDVSKELANEMWEDYLSLFPKDQYEHLKETAAILIALRHTRILGVFARLALRDNKSKYLLHLPRILSLLKKSLGRSEALKPLKEWYEENLFAYDNTELTFAA